MSRELWLIQQMESDDFDMSLFDKYNKELNEIQSKRNEHKRHMEELRRVQEMEHQQEAELEKLMSLTEEMVEKMYTDTCLKYQDVNGMSFKNWYDLSLRYYSIDESFNVHARARSSNTVEIVAHVSFAQAKLTILKRIRYKFYDHAVRGHDFAWDID